jgi:FAD/FMN-containing dehydrogenase
VLVECAGAGDQVEALGAAVAALDGVIDAVVAEDRPRRTALWRHREALTEAIAATLGPHHKLDVSLPADALAAFAEEVPARVTEAAPGARTWLFGHLGDGNLHVNITDVAPDDLAVDDAVLGLVLARHGSISAEHGVGTAKRRWVARQRGADAVTAMRAVKAALDPAGILNPHVLFGDKG